MSAFSDASKVETRAMTVLLPYLDAQANGRVVLTAKGTLARFLQLSAGDALLNDREGRVYGVEIKAEERHTGNLFLETWSNKNLRDPKEYANRGSTMGWLYSCRADMLLYYFLDTDDLYTVPMFRLKRWAFGTVNAAARIYDFPEREQSKYDQLNDTHGRLVPVATLAAEVEKFRSIKVRQMALWANEQAA